MQDISFEGIKSVAPIIAIAIGIPALIIAVLNFYVGNWWRLRKSLAYEIVTFTAIVGIKDKVKDRVQILFDGKEIPNAQLYEIKIINDGKQQIVMSDFEKPLEILFDSDAEIFSAEVAEIEPNDLSLDYKIEKNKIIVEPLLLNGQDAFSIKGIVNAKVKDVICNARIAGVKKVKFRDEFNQHPLLALVAVACLILSIVFIILSVMVKVYEIIDSGWLTSLLPIAGAFYVTSIILSTISLRKRFNKIFWRLNKKD
jgi:hypothetical protein